MTKKISLRVFNLLLFSVALIVMGLLLFFQYKSARDIIVDCFSEKKVSRTLHLQKALKTIFIDKAIILLDEQRANVYTYQIKNFNLNSITNQYDRLYINY